MNCKYCQQEAAYKPIERVEAAKGKIYWCYTCHSEIIHWQRGNRITHSLYVTVNGRMFRWTTSDEEPDFASLWRIGKPGVIGESINEDVKCIATFGDIGGPLGVSDIIPEITPQNIQDKLSKYLPFL
jgi:hypothetical protein